MSQYKVINRFQEKNHDGHVYEEGKPYPAEGKKLVKARAEFLTKVHAEYGVAFLEAIEEPKNATTKQSNTEPSTDGEGAE
ncbi:hypothetical protein AAGS61_02985 [Lysinibacillus sp. KU-BSD001]|uniref:hypothetical protein n=1 Tax=Lysinibacillus sp. KU-BSD001 TaxID=3141328 RepID=UPI0036E36191